jgi:glyoxylase-like metal-dependent hydrolase (beta-lactamase superfamily II)
MNGSTVVIAPPDGDMAAYLSQLERLRGMQLASIAPGHGKLITDPIAKIHEYLDHRRAREAQIAAILAEQPAPANIDTLLPLVYQETPEALRPVAKYSLWAHLRKLTADGRASSTNPDAVDADWVAQ